MRPRGTEVVVAVSDEGPGLKPGEEEQVFERFARGSGGQGTPGTGLGLAIVATLARRWGGSARISNRVEGGARAEVRFPPLRRLCKPRTGAWTRLYPAASSLFSMRITVVALLGLVFATGLGFGAHVIARDTVALPVASLDARENLAPAATTTEQTTRRPRDDGSDDDHEHRHGAHHDDGDRDRRRRRRRQGRGRGRGGRRFERSGSSGSGSSGSGSSGSGGGDDD